MSETIWAVSHGSYSDYSVIAVFTTKAKAEEAAALWNKRSSYEQYEIQEFSLDPPLYPETDENTRTGFNVWVHPDRVTCSDDYTWPKDEPLVSGIQHYLSGSTYHRVLVTYQEARDDPERAKKIATDRLAQWKAEQEGIA